MDPLGMLRDYTIRSRLEEISISNDRISFADEYDFPKAIPTAYRSQQGQGEFYVLETLVVFLRNLTLPHSAYMRKTAQGGVPAVTFQDRKVRPWYIIEERAVGSSPLADLQTLSCLKLTAPALYGCRAIYQLSPAFKDLHTDVPAGRCARLVLAAPGVVHWQSHAIPHQSHGGFWWSVHVCRFVMHTWRRLVT